jgi:hypothetical protein
LVPPVCNVISAVAVNREYVALAVILNNVDPADCNANAPPCEFSTNNPVDWVPTVKLLVPLFRTLPDKIMDDPVSVEASNSEFVAMLDPVIVL